MLASVSCVVLAAAAAAVPSFGPGLYRGQVFIATGTVSVALTLQRSGRAAQSSIVGGHIDIVEQGLVRYPITELYADEAAVRFALPALPGDPRFTLAWRGERFDGVYTQGRKSYRVALKPVAASQRLAEAVPGLSALLKSALTKDRTPGVAYGVVIADAKKVGAEGVHGTDVPLGLTADTPFPIGGLTHTVLEVAVARHIEQGRLTWTDRVADVLPSFRLDRYDAGHRVTVTQLIRGDLRLPPHPVATLSAAGLTPPAVLDRLSGLPLATDTRTVPSDWAYAVLGQLISTPAGGADGTEAVKSLVLGPAIIPMTYVRPERCAIGHILTGPKTFPLDAPLPGLPVSRGLYSSARALTDWLDVHLRRALLSAQSWDRLDDRHAALRPGALEEARLEDLSNGQWRLASYRGHQVRIAQSLDDGFSVIMVYAPNDQAGVVVLANRSPSTLPFRAALHVLDLVLGLAPRVDLLAAIDRDRRAAPAAGPGLSRRVRQTVPAHPRTTYVGTYSHPGYGDVRVEYKDQKLVVNLGQLSAPLAHWHYETFVSRPSTPGLPTVPWTFITDVEGRVVAVTTPLEPRAPALRFERKTR